MYLLLFKQQVYKSKKKIYSYCINNIEQISTSNLQNYKMVVFKLCAIQSVLAKRVEMVDTLLYNHKVVSHNSALEVVKSTTVELEQIVESGQLLASEINKKFGKTLIYLIIQKSNDLSKKKVN